MGSPIPPRPPKCLSAKAFAGLSALVFVSGKSPFRWPKPLSAAVLQAVSADLISFLKVFPVGEAFSEGVGRYRPRVRFHL